MISPAPEVPGFIIRSIAAKYLWPVAFSLSQTYIAYMKKFILICAILFVVNVGCKKMNVGGEGLCACSPITGPELNLVVQNAAGLDLLASTNTGSYTKEKIELYRKDSEGKVVPLNFGIRSPFSYGDEKFSKNFLFSNDLRSTSTNGSSILFLKLGDKVYELNLVFNKEKFDVDRLLIDNKEVEKDKGTVSNYLSIFYLTE